MLIGYQQGLVLKSLEYIVVQCNILLGDETCTCKRWDFTRVKQQKPALPSLAFTLKIPKTLSTWEMIKGTIHQQ